MTFNLICGDCCAIMRNLNSGSFDTVVTSPPYNLGIKYKKYKDNRVPAEYLAWTETWTKEVYRLLAQDGSFFLNIAGSHEKPWLPFEVALSLRNSFVLQNTFHWIKAISLSSQNSFGHFKPVNSKRYVTSCHEFVFHFTKTGKAPLDRLSLGVDYVDKSNIKRWKHTAGKDKRCRGNTWYIPYNTVQSFNERPHPAVFPVDLAENCIRLVKAQSVLDPFVGIGSSLLAAFNCKVRTFVGIDIDESYLATASELASSPPV